jgi:hypothetical protein
MNTRIKNSARSLGIIIISMFGFLLIITLFTEPNRLIYGSKEMLDKMSTDYTVDSASFADMKDYVVVEIRQQKGALAYEETDNLLISLHELLADDYRSVWNSQKAKVIKSDNAITAHQSWSLLSQMGYRNLYVYEE